jgi:hypothetical protein
MNAPGTEAILAPVPADLLQDALDNGYTRVAFGSMAWEFFRRLTDEIGDEPLLVLLYASHEKELALEVTWAGEFAGWREAAQAERDPDFEQELRSPLARYDWLGNEQGGGWAVYWIVEGLHRLEDPMPLKQLRLPNGKQLSAAFIPRGPIRVAVR